MDPCVFNNKTNPVTKSKCRETFTNLNQTNNNECYTCYKIPKDPITQVYFASVGLLGVYIFYKLLLKNGMLPKR
jgi:hypothetical protein